MKHDWSGGRARLVLLAAAVCVAALAGYLNSGVMHDVVMWDEADYAVAARQGVVANALNKWDLNRDMRHYHAPLSFYAVWLSTAVFGLDTCSVRLPGVVVTAMAAGLAVVVTYSLARGRRWLRVVLGSLAGLLYATAPAAVGMTTMARPHPFVAFFLLLNLWTLCRYLLGPTTGRAVVFGLTLAGQFVSMEYGPIVTVLGLLAVAVVRPRRVGLRRRWPYVAWTVMFPFVAVHRHIWVMAGSCVAGIGALWPAGLYRLSVLLNFAYYVRYASGGHRTLFRGQVYEQVPKYAYAWWYAVDYPVLLAGVAVGVVLIVLWAWKQRGAVAVTLAVFTLGIAASIHSSHIMELCYSLYLVPVLAVGGPLAGQWLVRWLLAAERRRRGRVASWYVQPGMACGVLTVIVVGSILGGQVTQVKSNDNANAKLVAVSEALARAAGPGDEVLAQAWPVVRYVLLTKGRSDVVVHPYNPSNYESVRFQERLDAGRFDWAITAGSTALAHPNCPLLADLRRRWSVVVEAGAPPGEYRLYGPPGAVHGAAAQGFFDDKSQSSVQDFGAR